MPTTTENAPNQRCNSVEGEDQNPRKESIMESVSPAAAGGHGIRVSTHDDGGVAFNGRPVLKLSIGDDIVTVPIESAFALADDIVKAAASVITVADFILEAEKHGTPWATQWDKYAHLFKEVGGAL